MSTLNPEDVPPFPVYALEYDGDTVLLDKVIVEPAVGQELTEAGLQAVARKASDAGLDAVRVRVVTPDDTHLMIVNSEGDAEDITPSDEPTKPSRRKRGLIIGAAVLTLALLAGGGVAVGKAIKAANTEPVAAAPPPIPGEHAAIPIGLPPGFGSTADWSLPVADGRPPVVMNNGQVLLTTPDDRLEIHETKRAQTVWSSSTVPNGTTPIVETTWTDRPVLASATGRALTLWPLDLDDKSNVPAVEVDLNAQADVTYAGSAPLIDLGDYTVAVPAENGVQRVSVPPGTHPVAAGNDIIVSVGDNSIAKTAFTSKATSTTTDFERPKGTKGAPTSAIGLTPTRAVVTWKADKKETTALVDTEKGKVLATIDGRAPRVEELPQVDETAGTALAGSYFIRYDGDKPKIVDLDVASRDAVLDGNHVYTTNQDGPLDLKVSGNKVVPSAWEPLAPDDPPPAAVATDAAYVLAEKVDQSILYRAPRQEEETTP
ncbi:hypothetical protein [Brevibacterium linens]|uniref:hypothetical protein n=1 Tax=Brevibacterium linens TaxID=1703 RepID=UPI003F89986C